jgi:hypothetical protein
VKPGTLGRLALAGSRSDGIRVTLTAISATLAAVLLLSAAAVVAVPELGIPEDGSAGWNPQYSNPLIAEPGLRPGVVATLLLIAIPVLFLAGQSIRFGAPARDRRLAAMRLAGATPAQAVLVAATETVFAALLGSIAGTGVFLLLRILLDGRDANDQLALPTDQLPSVTAFLLVLLLVPLLAGLIGAFLLRRVIITPLGVVRRTRTKPPRLWPGVLIIAAVFAPLVIHPLGRQLEELAGGTNGDFVILIAFAAVFVLVVGVVVGTGWIAYTAGRLLNHFSHRPAALLAGRRLMADPWNGSRTLSALLAALIVGAGVLGYRSFTVATFAASAEAFKDNGLQEDGNISVEHGFFLNSISLVQIAVAVAVVIAAAGIMVALAESVVSRRRTFASLVATGVPRGVLGESLAWQTLAPLVPAMLVALTVGFGLFRSLVTEASAGGGATCEGTAEQCGDPNSPLWHTYSVVTLPVPVPLGGLALLGGGALAAMLLVVAVGYVFLRMSTDVEELRTA